MKAKALQGDSPSEKENLGGAFAEIIKTIDDYMNASPIAFIDAVEASGTGC
jgi:hypothetical protein